MDRVVSARSLMHCKSSVYTSEQNQREEMQIYSGTKSQRTKQLVSWSSWSWIASCSTFTTLEEVLGMREVVIHGLGKFLS